MKKQNILFRMAARCEAAGRPNNEDNYQLDADLSDNTWGFTADEEIALSDKGSLLVVCDGMGGMNAGEVASAIAVKTIKEYFAADKLTDTILSNPCKYIHTAIVAADAAIKEHSKTNPDTEGMGSTVVMAWLLGKKIYVGWCGDSRCYRYNPQLGLERLSHDHSYVQELVDAGKLTEELAFDHPNNNIITRSLGDPRGAAKPDTKEFDLYNQDIILLCSDGLCGTLRDNEIAEQIQQHQTSMQECRDALWAADEAAGWTDNTTIALAQIISGAIDISKNLEGKQVGMSDSKMALVNANKRLKLLLIGIIVLVILCVGGGFAYSKLKSMSNKEQSIVTPESDVPNEEQDSEVTTPQEREEKKRKAEESRKAKETARKAEEERIKKQEETEIPTVKKAEPTPQAESSEIDHTPELKKEEVESTPPVVKKSSIDSVIPEVKTEVELTPKVEKSNKDSVTQQTKIEKLASVLEEKKDSTSTHNDSTVKQ